MPFTYRHAFAIVLIAVAGAAAAYTFSRNGAVPAEPLQTGEIVTSTSSESSPMELAAAADDAEPQPFTASLEALVASGKDYGCHYQSPPEEGDIIGTVFVSEGRARGTMVGDIFETDGSLMYFLITDERAYLWFSSDGFDEPVRGTGRC